MTVPTGDTLCLLHDGAYWDISCTLHDGAYYGTLRTPYMTGLPGLDILIATSEKYILYLENAVRVTDREQHF